MCATFGDDRIATVPQSLSCHFRGCKVPLFRIVSGAISSELALPLPFLGVSMGRISGFSIDLRPVFENTYFMVFFRFQKT